MIVETNGRLPNLSQSPAIISKISATTINSAIVIGMNMKLRLLNGGLYLSDENVEKRFAFDEKGRNGYDRTKSSTIRNNILAATIIYCFPLLSGNIDSIASTEKIL